MSTPVPANAPDPSCAEDCAEDLDLVRYREGVEALYQLSSDKVISNSEHAHASVLFELFFKHATDHVRIFCRKLSQSVFDHPAVIREAGFALKRGVRVTVLYQNEVPEDGNFLALLKKSGSRVERTKVNGNSLLNFAVMDKRCIRLEPEGGRGTINAQARMYAPEMASRLSRYFDLLVLHSATPAVA